MKIALKHCLATAGIVLATQAAAQVTFYEGENFRGRAFTADRPIGNFDRFGFNDRASSAIVERGRWEVCDDSRFRGRCVVLRRGNYPTLDSLGLGNRISSVRPVERSGYSEVAPPPPRTLLMRPPSKVCFSSSRLTPTWSFVEPKTHTFGVPHASGPFHVEEGMPVTLRLQFRGLFPSYLMWMTTEDMLEDMAEFVASAHLRELAPHRDTEREHIIA